MSTTHYSLEEQNGTLTGVHVAKVTDNKDPESLGRVKLVYPWRDNDDESYWARIATEMTGKGYGTYYLPEPDDEVLIAFENGDIHYPVVIGSLWSGNRPPPEDNSDGKNDIRAIETRAGHRIEFDDGSEGRIRLETDGGQVITLADTSGGSGDTITIEDSGGNSIEMDAGGKEISISAENRISLDAPTISLSAQTKFEAKSNGKAELAGTGPVSISSNGQVNVDSNGLMGISATGPLTIRGAIIQLN